MSMASEKFIEEINLNAGLIGGKKSERIYAVMKQAILFRHIQPGAQLLEQELAARFGCSQSTVREALMRLDDDGLVSKQGYHGTRVTDTSLDEARQMVFIRLSIERSVARKLAVQGFGVSLAELEHLIEDMNQAHGKDDLYRSSELDRRFHCGLVKASGMQLLSPLLERCALHIHRFTLGGVEVARDFYQEAGVGQEHEKLLLELQRGDPDRAERALAGHLGQVLKRWSPSLYKAVGPSEFK